MSFGCLARQNRKQCVLNPGHSGDHRYNIVEPRCQSENWQTQLSAIDIGEHKSNVRQCVLNDGHAGDHQYERRDPVVNAVRQDLLRRSQFGIQKYGVTLERQDLTLRDWLQHAYEETLDTANYLKRSIMELNGQTRTVVIGIAERNDTYLIGLRRDERTHGRTWEFPGGKVEPGETHGEALKREWKEELGVELTSAREVMRTWSKQFVGTLVFMKVEFVGEPLPIDHKSLAWATYITLLRSPIINRLMLAAIVASEEQR